MKSTHSLSICRLLIMLLAGLLLAPPVLAADGEDASNQADIEFINRWPSGSPHTIAMSTNYVFVGDGNIISVYNKTGLVLETRIQINLSANGQVDKESEVSGFEGVTALYYLNNYLYAACGNEGLKVYDATDPANMTAAALEATYIPRESDGRVNVRDVRVNGNYAYITYAKFGFVAFNEVGTSSAGYTTGIQILDVSDPAAPDMTADYELTSVFGDIAEALSLCYWEGGSRQLLLVADYYQGIHVIDVSNPATPVEEGFCYMGSAFDLETDGDYIYVATGSFGLSAIEADLASDSRFADGDLDAFPSDDEGFYICQYNAGSSGAVTVELDGDYAYVGDTDLGIVVLDISDPTTLADTDDDTGQYTAVVGQFSSFDVGYNSKPGFFDLDSDGDLDALSGTWTGYLYQFENAGAVDSPGFANPISSGKLVADACTPAFGDVDGDTDDDLLLGQATGGITYYKNTGATATNPFEAQEEADNPFAGIDVGGYSAPALVDIDDDGDMDLFVGAGPDPDEDDGGSDTGKIFFYENDGTGTFTQQTGANNPLSNTDVPSDSTPAFADIDNDGDQDCFIGAFDGSIYFYENTGTAAAATFTEQTGAGNPLDGVGSDKLFSSPTFVDIDNDGDQDCFIGYRDGFTHFYENTGDAANPTFTRPHPDLLLTGEITGAYHLLLDSGNDRMYVGDHLEGLQVLDITTAEAPTLNTRVTDTNTPSDADAVFFNVNNAGIDFDDADNSHLQNYTFSVDDDATSGAFSEGVRIFYAVLSENYVSFVMKGFLATAGEAKDVYAYGNYLYIADGSDGLKIIDPDLPASSDNTKYRVEPALTGSLAIAGGDASGVYVSGNYAYVAAGSQGLRIVNISNPAAPAETGFLAGTDILDANAVYVTGNYAYVADGTSGVKVVDISDKDSPALVGASTISTDDARALSYSGTYLYLADGNEGFYIIDINDPSTPATRGDGYSTEGIAYGITAKYNSELDGDLIWIADGRAGLKFYVYYSTIPAVSFGSFNSSGTAKDVDVISDFAFISDSAGGLVAILAVPPDPATSDFSPTPVNLHALSYGDSSGCAVWTATDKGGLLNRISAFLRHLLPGD
ncbi:MAG: FG-GAP-like repeat-containing protein [Thermodesulfobacteriota bacterium]|nr:FG-GAP-like repeat-containing protein [Thermodesulfobacteriota bacterium]